MNEDELQEIFIRAYRKERRDAKLLIILSSLFVIVGLIMLIGAGQIIGLFVTVFFAAGIIAGIMQLIGTNTRLALLPGIIGALLLPQSSVSCSSAVARPSSSSATFGADSRTCASIRRGRLDHLGDLVCRIGNQSSHTLHKESHAPGRTVRRTARKTQYRLGIDEDIPRRGGRNYLGGSCRRGRVPGR
ncbi:hypothetical protein [Brevibacterium antiquum]|uniref:hypothetical protein n=1 Tax=Brevibacterium antiquum TaxID=234835 RepID=UPI001E2EEADA|nr:hypothetical protein [Brevibacterium antiquum]